MATAEIKTTVTSITLTLTEAEAEAVYALSGAVAGGTMTDDSYAIGPERAASDAVFYALYAALDRPVTETTFHKSLNESSRYVELLPAMPKRERELLDASED